jgi:hypothetical protein
MRTISQARAVLQSRATITADTLSISAVSSKLRPPKNRSSTTPLQGVAARPAQPF